MKHILSMAVLLMTLSVLIGCPSHDPKLTYPFHATVSLKDGSTMTIDAKFLCDSREGVLDVTNKASRIRYALSLAMADHNASEFSYHGKQRVTNVLRSISRQLYLEDTKDIVIVKFSFNK